MDPKKFNLKFQEEADPKVLEYFDKLSRGLALIIKSIPKAPVLPKIFPVRGDVRVEGPVRIANLEEVVGAVNSLEKKVGSMIAALSMVPQQKVEIPKIEFPKIELPNDPKLTAAISDLEKALSKSTSATSEEFSESLYQIRVGIQALVDKPTMTPTPVTHISTNALQGLPKATTLTVSTVATLIPNANLVNRRAIIVYNNDVSKVLYIGGSTVAAGGTGQGLPIPAGGYSPSLDMGQNMSLYGITASGTISVTALEVSDEASGR